MKYLVFPIIFILTLISCKKADKNIAPIVKEYGMLHPDRDTISVELKVSNFNSFEELLNRTNEITCNDSIPKITLKKRDTIKKIYFFDICIYEIACYKIKNTISIKNDSVIKQDNYYPLDSLYFILKKDLENYGKDPYLLVHPEKLLIQIDLSDNNLNRLPKILDTLSKHYEKITDTTNLFIKLDYHIPFYPPPPLPTKKKILQDSDI